MIINQKTPGVYIQEFDHHSHSIVGATTSEMVFVGRFRKGPLDVDGGAVRVTRFGDYEQAFGGLWEQSEASYAIHQFFLNGGGTCRVLRLVGNDAQAASILVNGLKADERLIRFQAKTPGSWGNGLGIFVDYQTTKPGDLFNVSVWEFDDQGHSIQSVENFHELSMTPGSGNYASDVVETNSKLFRISGEPMPAEGETGLMPAPCGTLSGTLQPTIPNLGNHSMTVTISSKDGDIMQLAEVSFDDSVIFNSYQEIVDAIQNQIHKTQADETISTLSKNVEGVVISDQQGSYLHFYLKPSKDTEVLLSFKGDLARALLLDEDQAQAVNVQMYRLGMGATFGNQTGFEPGCAQEDTFVGLDGSLPSAQDVIGDSGRKTGLHALDFHDSLNLLAIPLLRKSALAESDYESIVKAANDFCAARLMFFILDIPQVIVTPDEMKSWFEKNQSLRSPNSAVYYPNTLIPDPLNDFKHRSVASSGTIAGLIARYDETYGVWKAPAGNQAQLHNVAALEHTLSDAEHDVLNGLGVNGLRDMVGFGFLCYGARTMMGADSLGSEWKYISVRRLALYIESSLLLSLNWVTFEPNNETLWTKIQNGVTGFMEGLYDQGAFAGSSHKDSFFVICNSSTTTAADVSEGVLNFQVGFAPIYPAEFVILSLQLQAGQ